MIINQKYINHFIEFEGDVPFFYLDGAGLVTLGIGCHVFDHTYAMGLQMRSKLTSKLVSEDQIAQEYKNVAGLLPAQSRVYYSIRTSLYMEVMDRLALFETRLEGIVQEIERSIVKLDTLPDNVGLVLIDMAFMGVKRLTTEFPLFIGHLMRHDWKSAAKESERLGVSKSRNEWTRKTLEEL